MWRIAALAAVALVLAGTDQFCSPASERASFEVASDCGPAGLLALAYEAGAQGCGRCDRFVDAAGAGALGLPERGELVDAPPGSGETGSRGIAAGDFVLAGPVAIPGAVPPLTVDRVCRFAAAAGAGALAMTCAGAAPEAACAGSLTLAARGP